MVNKSNVQARKLDIAKIRLLYGRVCFMDKKWFALWTGLLYGQKVVCFMDRFALWSKSGLLYGPRPIKLGQKVVCFMVNKSVLIRVRTPPILLDLVLNKGGLSIRDAQIFACGARFTLRNPTLGA